MGRACMCVCMCVCISWGQIQSSHKSVVLSGKHLLACSFFLYMPVFLILLLAAFCRLTKAKGSSTEGRFHFLLHRGLQIFSRKTLPITFKS